jgi:hypothetical protein
MSRSRQQLHPKEIPTRRVNYRTTLLFFGFTFIALNFSVCRLQHATARPVTVWRCEALVRDAATQEPFRVTSDTPFNPLPAGGRPRLFINQDWDADGDGDFSDVITDWRRYIANNILRSAGFTGRSWCIDAASVNCDQTGSVTLSSISTLLPSPLPSESLRSCPPERSDALLEISAPGLTPAPDFNLAFPDTPIGLASAPITIRLRNAGSASLRVNGTDLLGAPAEIDFIEPAGGSDCLPTADEIRRGVGRELAGGRVCGFQVQFRPQFRPGVGECDRDDTTGTNCTRVASLRITSTTIGGNMLPTAILNLRGRAIGGRLVIEPASGEICFTPPATPLPDLMCTEERRITIRNEGTRATTGDLTITSAGSIPIDSFRTLPVDIIGRTLAPGESLPVSVRYCERRDRGNGVYRIYSSSPRGPNPVEITIFNPNIRACP